MFGAWLHHVWCTLASIVLSVRNWSEGWRRSEVLGLVIRLTGERSRRKDHREGDEGKEGILVNYLSEVY